jgi:Uma2 family endonuclease
MSSATQQIPRRYKLTMEEYHRIADARIFPIDARTELIDGEIIEMVPIGAPHAGITKRLINLFTSVVRDKAIIDAQDPVVLGVYSEPQPDLALLRWRDDFYVKSHPRSGDILLLVEIADTTLDYDRDTKIPLYAQAGVSEVWLIDLKGKRVDIFRQPEDGRYTSQHCARELGRLQVEALPELDFDLSRLFDDV